MASRRLSHAGVETEVDASPIDEDAVGAGIGCMLIVEVVADVGPFLWRIVAQGGKRTGVPNGMVAGMMVGLWFHGLMERVRLLYCRNL